MDRGAWWAIVHGVAEGQTRLSDTGSGSLSNTDGAGAPTTCSLENLSITHSGPSSQVPHLWVQPLGWEDPLEKEMATHSSILAWRILWTEEPGGLQSMGSQRVGHDRARTHI